MQSSGPRITVGLPMYKGGDLIAKALACVQQQTFRDFEAIISIDGNDTESAAACRPFVSDPRFRMVVHPMRLDWVGNFNWLLHQPLREFFCYRQHDDLASPEYFEVLLRTADLYPSAACVYCDVQFFGARKDIEIAPPIEGDDPLDRMLQYIERLRVLPLRGLIRSGAIREAGLVRFDEFRAPHQVHGWLAKLLRYGEFKRLPKPLYFRLDHSQSFTAQHFMGAEDQRRAACATLFTTLLDAVIPLCRTAEERRFFQQAIFERVVAYWNRKPSEDAASTEKLITNCLERVAYEGNTALLRTDEAPAILRELRSRLKQVRLRERSPLRKGIHELRQRARFARLMYPKSFKKRAAYLIRYLRHFLYWASSRMTFAS